MLRIEFFTETMCFFFFRFHGDLGGGCVIFRLKRNHPGVVLDFQPVYVKNDKMCTCYMYINVGSLTFRVRTPCMNPTDEI